MRSASIILVGTVSWLSFCPPAFGRAVHQREDSEDRANAVRDAFQFAWEGYMKYAYPNDELKPVTNTSSNSRNGWGASSVDALSTACVMRLPDIVDQVLTHVATIDFSQTGDLVNLFETTIRYLGGLLSGYSLLSGPLPELSDDPVRVYGLLDQARKLADRLAPAFDTPTGIPFNYLNITNGGQVGDGTNSIATIGTLVLEWTRLGDFLGDQGYGALAQRGESYLLNPKPPSGEPFPGLIGTVVNIDSGDIMVSSGGWGGGDDSFYEYLIKMYVYDRRRFAQYKDRWILAADSTITYLRSHPTSRPDLTFVAGFNGQTPVKSGSHLSCFAGGNFILGGTVLDEPKYVDFGLELVNGCHQTYIATATRIGPEGFTWDEKTVRDRNDQAFFDANGFSITNAAYILRPEVIESYYYAYRATGDSRYQDWAWDAFFAINATTRTGSGLAGMWNVNMPGGGDKIDMQESFLFAEVFKYAYLIFAKEEEWQVAKNGTNAWVFNTEGHPMEVVGHLRR